MGASSASENVGLNSIKCERKGEVTGEFKSSVEIGNGGGARKKKGAGTTAL